MASVCDMTSGNLWKQMFFFSIPLMFSNLMQVLFNMSDVAIVGRFAGSIALGSVGSTTILVSLFVGFLIGLGGAVNALTARYIGARDYQNVSAFCHTAAIVCFAGGIVILTAGELLAKPILLILSTKDELLPGALLYLRIYFLSAPAMALFNYGNGVLSSVGDTKRPLVILIYSGLLNVLLNIVFVVFLRMDVDGVATATCVAEYLSAFLILRCLFHDEQPYRLSPSEFKWHRYKASLLLRLGIPAGLQSAIFAIANLFIQSAVNSFDSTMVAGSAAAANCETISYTMIAAFYTAAASFLSQNYGARQPERMKKACFIGNLYSCICSFLVCGLFLILRHPFLSLFTTDESVIHDGMYRLVVLCLSIWISTFMDNTVACCRGLGKTLVPTLIVIGGSCIFRIIWIYTIFAHFHTPTSLFTLYPCSWTITSVAIRCYFVYAYKQAVRNMHLQSAYK